MPAGLVVRHSRWFVFLLIATILLNVSGRVPSVAAQGQQVRLGDMRVDWYCLQRGYSAWIINNGTDWACTASNGVVALLVNQSDFNGICQGFYGNSAAYAARDRNSPFPALDWACYVTIPPTPTFTPTPALQPMRLGGFQVEWYCNERNLGVRIINNQSDWACTQLNSDQIVFVLGQGDFDTICRRTYNRQDAYALRDQQRPEPAYNWSCYVDVPVTTPTPAAKAARLGDFQVEWYCAERGFSVRVINNGADWACTQPNSDQVVFVLTQQDFDQICRRTYNNQNAFALRDQQRPQPAYDWSCYTYPSQSIK
jgi:membrane-bound inhibitor of C-type lysozyme